jgi:RNase P/RNase MRP subunit POP5
MIAKNVLSSAVRSMFGIVGSSRWSLDLLEWSDATSSGIIAVSREYAIHWRHFICEVRSDQHSHHVPSVFRFAFGLMQGTGAHSQRTHVLWHL